MAEAVDPVPVPSASDRRDNDRRAKQEAFPGDDRREGERRSGSDRRAKARARLIL